MTPFCPQKSPSPCGRRLRTAVFGGTFDPIHTGHAVIAGHVAQRGAVDEVWLMVSPQNPVKEGRRAAPANDRLDMARLVASRLPGVEASDFEFSLPLPSYTYRTLTKLRESYPERDFVLLIGSDNWAIIDAWRDPDKIIAEFGLLVYERPGYPVDESSLPAGVRVLRDTPQIVMSSTYVRRALADGKKVDYCVPESVADYISGHNLYKI